MKKVSKNPYFVYIVKCSDKTLYTGISNNLERRLRQHNGEIVGGAFYTQNKRPVKLVYKEKMKSHSDAIKRELEIKKLTRKQKMNIVEKYLK